LFQIAEPPPIFCKGSAKREKNKADAFTFSSELQPTFAKLLSAKVVQGEYNRVCFNRQSAANLLHKVTQRLRRVCARLRQF